MRVPDYANLDPKSYKTHGAETVYVRGKTRNFATTEMYLTLKIYLITKRWHPKTLDRLEMALEKELKAEFSNSR